MVKIRLSRQGKTNDPFYRVVAIESQNKRGGTALEVLGHWHPRTNDKKIDKKAIEVWIEKGAQPSQAVLKLIES